MPWWLCADSGPVFSLASGHILGLYIAFGVALSGLVFVVCLQGLLLLFHDDSFLHSSCWDWLMAMWGYLAALLPILLTLNWVNYMVFSACVPTMLFCALRAPHYTPCAQALTFLSTAVAGMLPHDHGVA